MDVPIRINRRTRLPLVLLGCLELAAAAAWAAGALSHPLSWVAVAFLAGVAAVHLRQAAVAAPKSADDGPERLASAIRAACERVGLAKPPEVVLSATAVPSICAVVRPSGGRLCVTTRALQSLDDPCLEALMLHELAHLRSRRYALVAARRNRVAQFVGIGGAAVCGAAIGRGLLFPWVALLMTDVAIGRWVTLVFRPLTVREEFAADAEALAMGADPNVLAEALGVLYAVCETYNAWLTRGPVWWLLSRPVMLTALGAPSLRARLEAIRVREA